MTKNHNVDSTNGKHPYHGQIFGVKYAFAWALICAEQFARALWRIVFLFLFFSGLWMLQIPDLFEQTGRYVAFIIFAIGLIYFIYRDALHFRFPRSRDITRRLEQESGIKHRPLTERNDEPVFNENDDSYKLWAIEQRRRESDLDKIKLVRWRVFFSDRDPYALRLMAVLVFAAGLFVAGHQWQARLINGLIPLEWYDKKSNIPPIIVTLTPPEYTGIAQKVLQGLGEIADLQSIPENTNIHVLINNALLPPYIVMQGKKYYPVKIVDGGYEFSGVIKSNNTSNKSDNFRFDVKQVFISHYGFGYTIIQDEAPSIAMQELSETEKAELLKSRENEAELKRLKEEAFIGPVLPKKEILEKTSDNDDLEEKFYKEPKILSDSQIQIPLKLYDDYGVKTLSIMMELDDVVNNAPLGKPVIQTRSVMSPPAQYIDIAPVYDFTSHPWAGLPVTLSISAADHINQSTTLDRIEMRLPERNFQHPVARRIIALRKRLAWAPSFSAIEVQYSLERLIEFPQDFENDPIVYLTLRAAASRLKYSSERQNAPDYIEANAVMDLLWDIALRIEDGNLSIAARNLRHAQMRLETAIQNENLPPEQITGLMNDLRRAMGEYISEYSKELQKRFAEGEELLLTPEMLADLLDPNELKEFFAQMENEMIAGNSDNAQGMLSKLQRMLDMLNPDMALPIPEDMLFMADSVSELQQLIDMQKTLLDQTSEQAELFEQFSTNKDFGALLPPDMELFLHWGLDNLPPPPSRSDKNMARVPGLNTALNRSEQEALRYVLGRLMLDSDAMLGKIPEKMGLAEREMLGSSDDLRDTRPDEAIPHQELAIEYLSQAQQEMQDELEQRLNDMTGGDQPSSPGGSQPFGGFTERFGNGAGKLDPLGRPVPGGGNGQGNSPSAESDVKIPDEAERKRIEEILRTLRERSGELSRPRDELEYFQRLLRQF